MADDDNWVDQSADNLIDEGVQTAARTRDDAENDLAKKPPSWLESLFGYDRAKAVGVPDQRLPLEQRDYPDEGARTRVIANDAAYGEQAAPYISGSAKIKVTPTYEVPALIKNKQPFDNKHVPIDAAVAEQMARAHEASNRSAITKIGFDPGRMAVSPKGNVGLNVTGIYRARDDQMWYDADAPSTVAHESMHRGLQKLREAGQYPKDLPYEEEYLVRALMRRLFGDAEMKGVTGNREQIEEAGEKVSKKTLDDLEAKAAQYYANKRPRGPR